MHICVYIFYIHILHSYTLFYGNVHFNGCQMPLIFSHSRNPPERCRGPTRWQVLLERKSPGKKDPTHDQKQTDGWWNLQDVKVIYTIYIYLLEDIEHYMWYDIWIYVWLYIYILLVWFCMVHMTIICICGADQSLNASKPHLEPMVPWTKRWQIEKQCHRRISNRFSFSVDLNVEADVAFVVFLVMMIVISGGSQ